jgi:glycosyltransferase involved in cell wall biosynthesis
MNIQSDAIVCNQCDRTEFTEFDYNGHNIKWLSFAERGVGLNRNNGLMRATTDIVLFADDDVVYLDGYADTIARYYEDHPDADLVVFNMDVRRNGDFKPIVVKEGRASARELTGFGTFCISARREKLHFNNITFHLQFGGGARYSCGEDSLFLQDCYGCGLKCYQTMNRIGRVDHGDSTWFKGYTDKFFYDKGVLYFRINKRLAEIFALYHCVKHRRLYEAYGWKKAFYQMRMGIAESRKRG